MVDEADLPKEERDRLEAQRALDQENVDKAFREVARSAAGKRVLFWMLEQCAIYADAYAGEATNATNYALGRQGVGRRIIGKLDDLDPRLYPQLLLDVADLKAMDRAAMERAAEQEDGEDEAV